MKNNKYKEKLVSFFKSLEWPKMSFEDKRIFCPSGDIVTFNKDNIIISFHFYNKNEDQYEKKEYKQVLIISNKINLENVLKVKFKNNYDIPWFDYMKDILNIDKNIKEIKITKGKKIIRRAGEKSILIPEFLLIEMQKDILDVYKRGKSSKNRLETYLINKLKLKYTNKAPKDITTVGEGDFSFLINRSNLKVKNSKKDYDKFLNAEDIKSLEYFTEKLIHDEVFSSNFLKSLDEYFIKEKLRDIIFLGREILKIKTSNMETKNNKKIVSKVLGVGFKIKQLETFWQKYFEKYLLYLVFSYKKIYPKIEFESIEGEKKYPDFIGINHYNGLDVIEIKTHLKNAMTWDASHDNFSFSSELSKAIIQTMNYMDAIVQKRFKDYGDQSKITNFTEEENLYHPRGIIIVSSDFKLTNSELDPYKKEKLKRDFTKLRNSLQNIEILTFSEILQIADDYVKNIHSQYK